MIFKMLDDILDFKKGELVYLCNKYDHGLKKATEQLMKEPCINITKNTNGDYPLFSMPERFITYVQR